MKKQIFYAGGGGLKSLGTPDAYHRIGGDVIETVNFLSNIYDRRLSNFLSKNNFFYLQGDINGSCLHNMKTSTSENG